MPAKIHEPAARSPDDPRAAWRLAVGEVLDADQRRLGPAQIAPELRLRHRGCRACTTLPEEVVRREEHEVAAEVAVALDEVVLACRHVLVVAREDDQVVGASASARGLVRASRSDCARTSTSFGPSTRASAGTEGRSGGSCTARRGSGTAARAERSSSSSPRTRSRPGRRRLRRAGCTPARSESAGRPRRGARRAGAAGRRTVRSRRARRRRGAARSRDRSASRRSATDTTRRPRARADATLGVTGTPFIVLVAARDERSGPERKICSFRPCALIRDHERRAFSRRIALARERGLDRGKSSVGVGSLPSSASSFGRPRTSEHHALARRAARVTKNTGRIAIARPTVRPTAQESLNFVRR